SGPSRISISSSCPRLTIPVLARRFLFTFVEVMLCTLPTTKSSLTRSKLSAIEAGARHNKLQRITSSALIFIKRQTKVHLHRRHLPLQVGIGYGCGHPSAWRAFD